MICVPVSRLMRLLCTRFEEGASTNLAISRGTAAVGAQECAFGFCAENRDRSSGIAFDLRRLPQS
jgi:hypothetical protein